MRVFQLFIISAVFTLICVISITAQTEKSQSVKSGKVAVINFELLKDEKTGIKDFADVYKKLEIEFEPQEEELKPLYEKRQNSIKKLQELEKSIHIRVTQEFLDGKVHEYEYAACKYDRKLKEVKSLFDKRKLEVFADLNKKIAEVLKLFAKEQNYEMILDISKIDNGYPPISNNVTEEFIKFYNNQTENK